MNPGPINQFRNRCHFRQVGEPTFGGLRFRGKLLHRRYLTIIISPGGLDTSSGTAATPWLFGEDPVARIRRYNGRRQILFLGLIKHLRDHPSLALKNYVTWIPSLLSSCSIVNL